jgi:hypothetical protein
MSTPPVLTSNTTPNSFVSDRHANPLLGGGGASADKGDYAWAAILSIISTILFLALVAMQWFDLTALKTA